MWQLSRLRGEAEIRCKKNLTVGDPGSRSFSDLEEEVRATYGEPMGRPASMTQATPAVTMQRAATVPTRRSVPATGFGRRGAS